MPDVFLLRIPDDMQLTGGRCTPAYISVRRHQTVATLQQIRISQCLNEISVLVTTDPERGRESRHSIQFGPGLRLLLLLVFEVGKRIQSNRNGSTRCRLVRRVGRTKLKQKQSQDSMCRTTAAYRNKGEVTKHWLLHLFQNIDYDIFSDCVYTNTNQITFGASKINASSN